MTDHPTGLVAGVFIAANAHDGLRVFVNGKPGRLAVLDAAGNIVADGPEVAKEAEAVAVNAHRNYLRGMGHLMELSKPVDADPAGAQEQMAPTPRRRHGER